MAEAIGDEPSERFRDLAAAFPDGILIVRNFRTIFANPAAVRLFGASGPDSMLDTPVAQFFHPESRDVISGSIERWLRGDAPQEAGAKIRGPDDALRDVEVRPALLGDPAASVALIIRDVTERRRAELALRESEERLRLAFAGAEEGVWDWNLETGAVVYSE